MNIKSLFVSCMMLTSAMIAQAENPSKEFITAIVEATVQAMAKTKEISFPESVHNVAEAYKAGTMVTVHGLKEATERLSSITHTHHVAFPHNKTLYTSLGFLGAVGSLYFLWDGIRTSIKEMWPEKKDGKETEGAKYSQHGLAKISAGLIGGICSLATMYRFGA